MPEVNPQFVAQVGKIVQALDTLDYFQLLRVSPEATYDEIRAGYHQQAKTFHPDGYHHLGQDQLVRDLTKISKRITEAYVTLRDDKRRAHYRASLAKGRTQEVLRYTEAAERKKFEDEQAEFGDTPGGRKMAQQAIALHRGGDVAGAIKTLQMAIVYEPSNQKLKSLLQKWQSGQ